MTSNVACSHLPESLYGPCGCLCYREITTPKSKVQNTSVSQLNHLPHLSVPDVFTLVSLMGLYLSEAHPKTYKELIAYVDDGHELTLDKFLPNPPSDTSTDGDAADDDYEDAE
jgi:hypothetical protein